jgi:hypothetical protein
MLIQAIRKYLIFRYLWAFMALHILNCSIDTPDAQPDYIAEDLSYNDIESITELILENILGIENAITEHDESDTEEGYSFQMAKIFLYLHSSPVFLTSNTIEFTDLELSDSRYKDIHYSQFHPEIVSPPPQA